jgi:hypothetical protein
MYNMVLGTEENVDIKIWLGTNFDFQQNGRIDTLNNFPQQKTYTFLIKYYKYPLNS